MIGPESKHRVTVWARKIEITTQQQSKTTWAAWGTYMGEVIQETGRSERQAVENWIAAAHRLGR